MNKNSEQTLTEQGCWEYIESYVFPKIKPSQKQDPDSPGNVGLEIEMFPFFAELDKQGYPISAPDHQKKLGVSLSALAKQKSWELLKDTGLHGEKLLTLIKIEGFENISFEPGGQLEFSSRPFSSLKFAMQRVCEIQNDLDRVFAEQSLSLLQIGVNPWHTLDDIGLRMSKKRYQAMDRYFAPTLGRKMMRQTATIQVCLDMGTSESQMVKRYLASQYVAPYLLAAFAHSPFVDRKATLQRSYRGAIWRGLDPSRPGFAKLSDVAKQLSRNACIQSYLDYALDASVIFVKDLDYFVPKQVSMRTWLKEGIQGCFPSLEDFINHLSLLFPEVRPRGFFELRSLDSQARVWQFIPAMVYCGLLYDDDSVDWLIDHYSCETADLEKKLDLASQGLQAPYFQKECLKIMEQALSGFQKLPESFTSEEGSRHLETYIKYFTAKKRTPADDLLDLCKNKKVIPTLAQIRSLHERWRNVLQS